MDARNDSSDMDVEFSYNEEVDIKEIKHIAEELLKPGINVSFEVQDVYEIDVMDDTHITLNIILSYDDDESQKKLINNIFNNDSDPRCGVLSDWSRHEKFAIEGFKHRRADDTINTETINDKKIMKVTFTFSPSNTDYLLQTLSMINDAINILKLNKVDTGFTVLNILEVMFQIYQINEQENCKCAIILNRLNAIIIANHELLHDDAISLLYCFSALKSFDQSMFINPDKLMMINDDIISTIDKIFLTKFTKKVDNLQNDIEYQAHIDKKRKKEVNEFLKRIHLWQRIKLYKPCLGKPAGDGDLYQWYYTEWDFLRSIKFELNIYGNIHIDLTHNTDPNCGYSKCYAAEQDQHNIFGEEITALGLHINLSFPDQVEWHKLINFMPECAQKLFDLKLHFDVNNIKIMLKARNNHRFFQQAFQEDSLFKKNIPEELVKVIFTLVYGPMLSPEELKLPLHQYNTFNRLA